MMKPQFLLLAGGIFAGLGLGWYVAPAAEVSATPAPQAPTLIDARVQAREARERLSELGFAPAPEMDAGPPPPDIALLFRRDLTAIEQRPAGRVVLIVDTSQAHQRRVLRIGDVYQDGWRVARIEAQSVQLRRRREVRTVDAFALPVIDP